MEISDVRTSRGLLTNYSLVIGVATVTVTQQHRAREKAEGRGGAIEEVSQQGTAGGWRGEQVYRRCLK